MAFTADTGDHKVTRTDTFLVDPRALVVNWKKNIGRGGVEPQLDEELLRMAEEMMPKNGIFDPIEGSSGQLQPILVRPLPDRRLEVFVGFRRTKAALHLIESGKCPDFKLKYMVSRLSDAEAAFANMVENLDRKDPEPIQLAYAIRSLTEDYGFALEAVAKRLKRSEDWCRKLLDLLILPAKVQASIASGETPVSAAMELMKLPGDKQVEVFDAAKASGEKLTVDKVKKEWRATQEKTGKGRLVPRTLADLKKFLEGRGGPFSAHMLEYLSGKSSEDAFAGVWNQLVNE